MPGGEPCDIEYTGCFRVDSSNRVGGPGPLRAALGSPALRPRESPGAETPDVLPQEQFQPQSGPVVEARKPVLPVSVGATAEAVVVPAPTRPSPVPEKLGRVLYMEAPEPLPETKPAEALTSFEEALRAAVAEVTQPQPESGRFSGNWEQYEEVLQQHRRDVAQAKAEVDVKGLNPPPIPPPPPLLPLDEAVQVWSERHAEFAGRLLTPPVGEVSPQIQEAQRHLEQMVQRLAGPKFEAQGMRVQLNLYGGEAVNAFAEEHLEKWDVHEWHGVSATHARQESSLATLRPLLDPDQRGGPLHEIGVTAGLLQWVQNEDELAFVLAHEIAHLLEGHTHKVGDQWLSSQSNEAVADHEAFQMMLKAGYDPARGVKALHRLHERHEGPEQGTLMSGLSAGVASHHHEGVRLALGQVEVEAQRRTVRAAQPGKPAQPIPEALRLAVTAKTSEVAVSRAGGELQKVVTELALDYLDKPLDTGYDAIHSLEPQGSAAAEAINRAPWDSKSAGQAYAAALTALDGHSTSSESKVNAALLLYHRLLCQRWPKKEGVPDSGQFGGQLRDFLARHGQSWSADSLREQLKVRSEGVVTRDLASDFAYRTLLNPALQEAVAPLVEDRPEWKKLYGSLPAMLEQSPYGEEPDADGVFSLAAAATVLGGKAYFNTFSADKDWPKSLPPGQGVLDDRVRKDLLEHLSIRCQEPGWQKEDHLRAFAPCLKQPGAFAGSLSAAFQPLSQALRHTQNQAISQLFDNQASTAAVFSLAEVAPLEPAQRGPILERLLQHDPQTCQIWGEAVEGKGIGPVRQFLGPILQDPARSASDKEKVFHFLLGTLYSSGERMDDPDLVPLFRYAEAQDPQSLLHKVGQELRPVSPEVKAERDQKRTSLGFSEYLRHGNPLGSLIGLNPELSKKLGAQVSPGQFQAWTDSASRPETQTKMFLLSALVEQQKTMTSLEPWDRAFEKLDNSMLDGRPDLRQGLADFLHSRLAHLEPEELRRRLKGEPKQVEGPRIHVQKLLSSDQTSDLLVHLVKPPDERPQTLAESLRGLEKEFGLESRPSMRAGFHQRVAEKARLQPGDLDTVLPPDKRSSTDQAAALNKEVRGLSAMVAATRGRSPEEQLEGVEYLMGRTPMPPQWFAAMDAELADFQFITNGRKLSQAFEETRHYLNQADMPIRTAVAASFLAGPSGLLDKPEGKEMLVQHLVAPISDKHRSLGTNLARVLLEAHEGQEAMAVGYVLAQRSHHGKALNEGEVLNSLFDAYGVPGIKLKQYLAFTSDFKEFRPYFESSQDNANPLNYLQALSLIQHHYGENWPKDWEVKEVLGSGSVNVAVLFHDAKKGEDLVVSLPRAHVETGSEYDFWRLDRFLGLFTAEEQNREKYGFLRGLTGVIRDSVKLEFDRDAAFAMQQSVQPFYARQVNGWTVQTIPANSMQGQAIVMDRAKGKTARKVLNESPETYRSAMSAMAQVEQDALLGIERENQPAPRALHANPDFHDGQVLIDEASQTVTILDFGQALPIDNEQREFAMDLLAVVGKGYRPQEAAKILKERTGATISAETLKTILASPDRMDVFTKLLGTVSEAGSDIPLPVVHWVLGMNRQVALGEKLGTPIEGKLKLLAGMRKTGGSLEAYNALRIAQRTPAQLLQGSILGPLGGWVGHLLTSLALPRLAVDRMS